MKLVIDSNRVIASLIRESTTRELIFDNTFELFSPDFIREELNEHREELMEKSGLSEEEFTLLLDIIFDKINVLNREKYKEFIEYFNDKVKDIDDLPYLAVCKTVNAEGIWTHDLHFKEQNEIKVFTNIDLLEIIRNS